MFTFEQRIGFIKEAIEDSFIVYENDFRESDKSYTIYLIEDLQKLYPNYNFSFIIGADNVTKLKSWHKFDELINKIDFIVIDRDTNDKIEWKDLEYYPKLKFLYMPLIDISSSEIRKKILAKEDVADLVPFSNKSLSL